MKWFMTTLFVLIGIITNAQTTQLNITEATIQKVTLTDLFLIKEISQLIAEEKINDSDFVVKGYVRLYISQLPYKNEQSQRSYHIHADYMHFDNEKSDAGFPPYYTIVANKLVLIYYMDLKNTLLFKYSDQSKKDFLQIIEPYLFAPETYMRDRIASHNGKYIFVFGNGKAPIVATSREAGIY